MPGNCFISPVITGRNRHKRHKSIHFALCFVSAPDVLTSLSSETHDKNTALSEFAERAVFLVKGAAVAGICAELLTVPRSATILDYFF
jgi:hypothetical protein